MKTKVLSCLLMALALCLLLEGTALAASEGFTYSVNSNKISVTITGYNGLDTEVVIPDKIDGLPVTAIGSKAFYGNTTIYSVTIPSTVLSIGSEAFCGCTGLNSVSIPDSVTVIYDGAFRGCVGLNSVTLPNKLTYISERLFYGCSGLQSISIPSTVTRIYSYACESTSLSYVTLPEKVTSIGYESFCGINSITISIPANTTSIDNYAFYNSTKVYFIVEDGSTALQYAENKGFCHTIRDTGYVKHYGSIKTKTVNGISQQYCDKCGKNTSQLSLTGQPQNAEGTVGNAVTLSVSAVGDGLTYKWYIKRATDAEFTKTNGVDASYTFTLTEGDNRAQLYCIVKDATGATVQSDTVTVKVNLPTPTTDPTPAANPATLTATASGMQADGAFTVALGINNNPGISFISVDSDAASKGITVENAQAAGAAQDWSVTTGSKTVLYANENMTQDGTFLVLTMKSASKEETELTFTVSECYNAQERAVSVKGTSVQVKKGSIIGDVNGDGTVDGRDLLRLARYLAGAGVEIDRSAADVNGDGAVDGRDVLRLAKKLAGM